MTDSIFAWAASGGWMAAFWLGVMVSISPCPLASNVASVAYLARRASSPGATLAGGLLYSFGRASAYGILGGLLAAGLAESYRVSTFLQRSMSLLAGPVLILVGLVMIDLVRLPSFSLLRADGGGKWAERLFRQGTWGALPLGFLFALSFCPVSAALFFGSLLPLAVSLKAPLSASALFGLGTALPVALFALLSSLGIRAVGRWFDRISSMEFYLRRGAGALFVALGGAMILGGI
jgi:cytochrome c biogenesis protein CcdA